MKAVEERITDLEIYLANQDRMLEELNEEVLRQSKIIEKLCRQNEVLMKALKDSPVKELSEETPPPHY
ncbi:MAG: SlyX family protein [Alphaproteobacteria bacterium]